MLTAIHLTLALAALPLFKDVSDTHLPQLQVQTKDAFPADLDGDGDLDLLIANEYRANVVLINDGQGRFTDQSADRLPQLDQDSEDVLAADFDGDGDLDALFVNEDDETNEYYANDGAGYFIELAGFPSDGVSNAVASADLNGDGAPDLVIGDDGRNPVLINDGAGGFRLETKARMPKGDTATLDLEFGDVDGDGDLDLIEGNEGPNRLLINDGSGAFTDQTDQRLPLRSSGENTREADFGDVDGDGDLDLYFANVGFGGVQDNRDRLLINDGEGVFTDETQARLPTLDGYLYTMDADFADLDGDGDLEIIAAGLILSGGLAPAIVRVFENDGQGRFSDATERYLGEGFTLVGTDIEAADFNGDGRIDLFFGNRAGPDRLFLRQ